MASEYTCDSYPKMPPEIRAPRLFYPVCSPRGKARHGLRAGVRLVPNPTRQASTARLCGTARRMGYEEGQLVRFFGSGNSFAQLPKAGWRRSSAYRPLLDLGTEEAAAMARVLIAASDDEAGPGGPMEEGIPETRFLRRLGPGVKIPFRDVSGARFPISPLCFEGFGAAWRLGMIRI